MKHTKKILAALLAVTIMNGDCVNIKREGKMNDESQVLLRTS